MVQHIDVSTLNQGSIADPKDNNRYIKYAADFGIEPLQFDFPSGASTLLSFGVPKCFFIDNQNNAFPLVVTVSTTNQSFPVPAQSAGFYYLDAVIGSSITITPANDPTGVVTFVFYNFDRSPVVWYKVSTTSTSTTVADGADVALGSTTDAANTNPATSGTLISFAKGLLSQLQSIVTASGSDGASNTASGNRTYNRGNLFNGTTWDRFRTITGALTSSTGVAAVDIAGRNRNSITTATTTVVKNAPGILYGVTINTLVASATITIYDNTSGSGTKIATITLPASGGQPFTLTYDAVFTTGLTIVTSGATDITVSYR